MVLPAWSLLTAALRQEAPGELSPLIFRKLGLEWSAPQIDRGTRSRPLISDSGSRVDPLEQDDAKEAQGASPPRPYPGRDDGVSLGGSQRSIRSGLRK